MPRQGTQHLGRKEITRVSGHRRRLLVLSHKMTNASIVIGIHLAHKEDKPLSFSAQFLLLSLLLLLSVLFHFEVK